MGRRLVFEGDGGCPERGGGGGRGAGGGALGHGQTGRHGPHRAAHRRAHSRLTAGLTGQLSGHRAAGSASPLPTHRRGHRHRHLGPAERPPEVDGHEEEEPPERERDEDLPAEGHELVVAHAGQRGAEPHEHEEEEEELHEEPEVPGYLEKEIRKTPQLVEGMTIAVEAIYNMGGAGVKYDGSDDWTIVTEDGTLAGLYERTILITDTGPELITYFPQEVLTQP